MTQPPGMLRLELAGLGIEAIDVIELDRDAGGNQPVRGVRRKGARPLLVPSKIVQVKRHSRLGYPHAA